MYLRHFALTRLPFETPAQPPYAATSPPPCIPACIGWATSP